MAHYAFLDDNNVVVEVITGRNEDEVVNGISDWEDFYGGLRGLVCKRTSYNSHGGLNMRTTEPGFRKNFAGIGFKYDESLDAFIPPKPYHSWILNEESCVWEPPVPMPEDEFHYHWDEPHQTWIVSTH